MAKVRNQHDSSEEDPLSFQSSKSNNHLSPLTLDYIQFLSRLLHLFPALVGQSQGELETLCHEIELASQRQAQLILLRKQQKRTRVPKSWHGFAVETCGRFYGRLYFAPDAAQPTEPVMPFPLAQFAANFCASVLYNLETITLIRGTYQLPLSDTSSPLTPREKDVLGLICRGYDSQAIVNTLNITSGTLNQYRRQILAKCGVRNEREAVFAAFSAGLFSPLEDLAPQIVHDFLKT